MGELLRIKKTLLDLRERFKAGQAIDESHVRKMILRSLKRCRERPSWPGARESGVPRSERRRLLDCGRPIMYKLLSSLSSVPSLIGLADSNEQQATLEFFDEGVIIVDSAGRGGVRRQLAGPWASLKLKAALDASGPR